MVGETVDGGAFAFKIRHGLGPVVQRRESVRRP
jgi:hypothetical protein